MDERNPTLGSNQGAGAKSLFIPQWLNRARDDYDEVYNDDT